MILRPEHGRAFGYFRTPELLRKLCKIPAPNIHILINLHAGIKDKEIGVNALHLLSMRLKNGDSAELALRPSKWDAYNIPARFFAFRRWHANLLLSRQR